MIDRLRDKLFLVDVRCGKRLLYYCRLHWPGHVGSGRDNCAGQSESPQAGSRCSL